MAQEEGMKIRFYVSPQIWRTDGAEPFYSNLLNDFIDVQAGESFTEVDNPGRRISLCCVLANDATHTAIAADSRIIVASPLANDFADLKSKLDTICSSIPSIATIRARFEEIGINTEWISGSNTLRDALRYLVRVFTFAQITDGENNPDVRDFVQKNLTTQIKDVPTALRTKVKDWMQARGLAVGWITNTTTVREVLHFIVTNLGIGKLKMSGEEF
jgi:hypothetical protein